MDPATTEIYTLSLHDALPISGKWRAFGWDAREVDGHDIAALLDALDPERWAPADRPRCVIAHTRSEEHTSELQSRRDLVCRLLLEKKKTTKQRRPRPTIPLSA